MSLGVSVAGSLLASPVAAMLGLLWSLLKWLL